MAEGARSEYGLPKQVSHPTCLGNQTQANYRSGTELLPYAD
jgi:hypothetical protein